MRNYVLFLMICLFVGCSKKTVTNNGTPLSKNQPSASPGMRSGTINGGGGVGIRCGDSLEMLDLYEARKSGLVLVNAPSSEDEAVNMVSARIAHHFWNVGTIPEAEQSAAIAKDVVAPIFEGRPFKNHGTGKEEEVLFVEKLPLSNDFGNYALPAGCSLEQIAIFSDSKTQLSIVKSAWSKLDWMSKSVLVAHELLYLLDRRTGLKNLKPKTAPHTSESTRKFVGQLFSVNSLPAYSNGVPAKEKLLKCMNIDGNDKVLTYFYAFNDEQTGTLSTVFNSIYGTEDVYQLRADFTGLQIQQLINENSSDGFSAQATLNAVGSGASTGFAVILEKTMQSSITMTLVYTDGKDSETVGAQYLSCKKY